MKWLKRFRLIVHTVWYFGLVNLLDGQLRHPLLRKLLSCLPESKETLEYSNAVRLRLALENLGPIFVKLGQVLSTRPDVVGPEYAFELAKLQDRVPAFDGGIAIAQIEKAFGKPIEQIYYAFEREPIASASIAQVHQAYLFNEDGSQGKKVAVKVLRPDIKPVIEQDLALMHWGAVWLEKLFRDGKRLKPREVVQEFDKYLHDELDLMHEAANASQLGRQFENSPMLIVPKVYFDFCSRTVMTMEWMDGTPISDVDTLMAKGIDLKKLARFGVEIFFTQVFKNGFFHADMHPGNIFVADDGRYIALDFGIVGTLDEYDKRYLAVNFLAFFNRDYHRVATAHIESGWVPADTRAEELEAAVRTVCEPIFNRPLSQISFGLILMRLFETSRRFNVEIQPQLVLLQKTLLNIEGLGRQLDPNLDLWATAKPFLVNWMNEQMGWKALKRNLEKEMPDWANILPSLPRRVNEVLMGLDSAQKNMQSQAVVNARKRQQCYQVCIVILLIILLIKLT